MAVALLSHYLNLPEACHVSQKLPKTFFKRNFDLTLSEKKLLEDFSIIQQMDIVALINSETANIPAFTDDDYSYEEVIVLAIQTTPEQFDRHKNKIIDFVQKYLPNPSLLMVYDSTQMILNVAEKRISQNDTTKRVIEKLYSTHTISLPVTSKNHEELMAGINFEKANKLNLQNYYQHFIQCFIGLQTAQINGTFVARPYRRSLQDALILDEIERMNQLIATMENQVKKETQLAALVQLNTDIQEYRSQIKQLTEKLSQ